jgi:hypothetical protein
MKFRLAILQVILFTAPIAVEWASSKLSLSKEDFMALARSTSHSMAASEYIFYWRFYGWSVIIASFTSSIFSIFCLINRDAARPLRWVSAVFLLIGIWYALQGFGIMMAVTPPYVLFDL